MRKPALTLLARLDREIDPLPSKQKRLRELLKPHDSPSSGWFMHVPVCFNDSLDIRTTPVAGHPDGLWTQGRNFSFSQGDILYNIPVAGIPWSETLASLEIMIQVTHAMAATPSGGATPRHPGSVSFTVFTPNPERTGMTLVKLCSLTQDKFIELIIRGFD